MPQAILKSLFAQKSWANAELFDVVVNTASQQPAATMHMAVRMLNHIHVVDCIFRAHLLNESHGYTATNTVTTPEITDMHFAVAQTDAWFESYVATVSAEALNQPLSFRFTDGDAGTMTRQEMLLHVITHGAYHRGNVGQMLKGIDVAPPRDLFTKFLHVSEPSRRLAPGLADV